MRGTLDCSDHINIDSLAGTDRCDLAVAREHEQRDEVSGGFMDIMSSYGASEIDSLWLSIMIIVSTTVGSCFMGVMSTYGDREVDLVGVSDLDKNQYR